MGFPARYPQILWEKQYYVCFHNKVIDPDFLLLVPWVLWPFRRAAFIIWWKIVTPGSERGTSCLYCPSDCVRSELKLCSSDSIFHVLTTHGNPHATEFGSSHARPLMEKQWVRRKEMNLLLRSSKLIHHINSKREKGRNLRICQYISYTTSDSIWAQDSRKSALTIHRENFNSFTFPTIKNPTNTEW